MQDEEQSEFILIKKSFFFDSKQFTGDYKGFLIVEGSPEEF